MDLKGLVFIHNPTDEALIKKIRKLWNEQCKQIDMYTYEAFERMHKADGTSKGKPECDDIF